MTSSKKTTAPKQSSWNNSSYRSGKNQLVADAVPSVLAGMPEDVRRRVMVNRAVERIQAQFAAKVSDFVLEHVNSVYLFKEEGSGEEKSTADGAVGKNLPVRKLVVYVDNSSVAAELNARRELIKLKYAQDDGIRISEFEIKISRGPYKEKYPYRKKRKESAAAAEASADVSREAPVLPEEERRNIERMLSALEEGPLKESFRRVLSAEKIKNSKK